MEPHTSMSTPDDAPDGPHAHAALVPRSAVRGETIQGRFRHMAALVGTQLDAREAVVRTQGDDYFVAVGPGQTLLFPADHPRHPESRYTWAEGIDGIRFGTRVEGA